MDTKVTPAPFTTPTITACVVSMSDKRHIASIHVILRTKEVVTFVEDVESEEEFRGIVEQFGVDAQSGEPIGGKDEHDDEVFIPSYSVSYIRGVFR